MTADNERLTILEMEYRIVAGRLGVIEAELAKMNQRLDGYDQRFDQIDDSLSDIAANVSDLGLRTQGTERAVRALLRHFNVDDDQ